MTDILDYRFPSDIALGAVGGPEFHTDIIQTPEGQEQRHIKRPQPRARYRLAYGLKNLEQLDQLRALYYLCKGRAFGFKFQDPLDHAALNQHIGTGDGEKTTFQFNKTYRLDEASAFTRKITQPHQEGLQVFLDGEIAEEYELQKQGIIVFEIPPEEGVKITASFKFDVPVRFDTDFLAQKIEGPNAALIDDIQLIELL